MRSNFKKTDRKGRCKKCVHSSVSDDNSWLWCSWCDNFCRRVAWNCGRGIFDPYQNERYDPKLSDSEAEDSGLNTSKKRRIQ